MELVAQSPVLGAMPCSLTILRDRSPRHGLVGGRPGCSRCAAAGVGGSFEKNVHAPAVATLRQPGQEGGHQAGCGRSALARAMEKLPSSRETPAVAGLRQSGREEGQTKDMHAPVVAVLR